MTGWSDDQITRRPDDQIVGWTMARRPDGQKSRWHIKQIWKKRCSQCYTGYTLNVLPDTTYYTHVVFMKGGMGKFM